MTPTLLLDLDDTLLSNQIEAFMPAYLSALSRHMASLVEPQRLLKALTMGTEAMMANQDPGCTLREVFDSRFYSLLGRRPDEIQAAIDGFYRDEFPRLKKHTRPIPAAAEMVEQALSRGYRLAIATNPLFPLTAIEQRLEWAGLPPGVTQFAIIPSYESMHFAKPSPALLAELLARLGWPDGPVVMVGDRLEDDVAPAHQLGLASYWVGSATTREAKTDHTPTGQGTIAGLLPWFEDQPGQALEPDFSSPSAMLAVMRSTPAALDYFCRELDPITWPLRPSPGEWGLTEILCHLRDVDIEVNIPRVEKVTTEANPFLPGMVTDPWAQERQYVYQDGSQALAAFIRARSDLLSRLESLAPASWERTARHAIFGPTHLKELVSIIAGHDRLHIQQVIHTLKSLQAI